MKISYIWEKHEDDLDQDLDWGLARKVWFGVYFEGWFNMTCWWKGSGWVAPREMGIPDHLTCLLRNLYAGQEATVRTRHGTMDWFQTGERVHQDCILSACLFNLYPEYIMWDAGLDKAEAGIKIAGEIAITSHMQMTSLLRQKGKRN